MGQITLRGMDSEVEKEIRRISKETGKSINSVIQDIIYKHTGHHRKGQVPHAVSLRKLAGNWSEKEASEFLEAIQSCRQIDPDILR